MAKKQNLNVAELDLATLNIETISTETVYSFGENYFVKFLQKDGERVFTYIIPRVEGIETKDPSYYTIEELRSVLGEADKDVIIRHKMYNDIKEVLLSEDDYFNPYLCGEAGTGKNKLCEQLAEDLGLPFYSQNSVQFKYDMIGYGNADGKYIGTPFYEAFVNGGLFFIDEMDISDAAAVKSLNQAIDSRYYSFPVVGMTKAHKDFKCIAGGNTNGLGAGTYESNVLDPSTLDRFVFIEVDYDEKIELKITNNNRELVDFFHAVRKASKEAGYHIVASYRGLKGITAFEKTVKLPDVLSRFLTKGRKADEINTLLGRMEYSMTSENKYAKALKSLAKRLS